MGSPGGLDAIVFGFRCVKERNITVKLVMPTSLSWGMSICGPPGRDPKSGILGLEERLKDL